jgi:ABC-type branched-subunit amino acid transport system substrate-binding protein
MRFRFVAVLAVAALAVTACGDDDDGEAAPTTTSATEVAGEPILVSLMGSLSQQPEVFDAAEAAASAINDAGGIPDPDGGEARPIEFVRCDEATVHVSPNNPLDCARKAIEADVVADVGLLMNGADGVTALTEAGIPLVGPLALVPPVWTEELSFPFSGAAAVGSAGLGVALQQEAGDKVAAFLVDTPARPALSSGITALLANGEEDLVGEVGIPLDASVDLAPIVAQGIANDPDGVAVVADTDRTIRVIQALQAAGYDGPIALSAMSVTEDILELFEGSDPGSLIIVSNFAAIDGDDETIAEFNEEMAEYAPDAARNELGLNAWLAVHTLADVLNDVDSIDRESIAAALAGREITDGAAPGYTLGTEGITFLPFPRVPRATVQVQTVEDGDIVPAGDGEFIDLNTLNAG